MRFGAFVFAACALCLPVGLTAQTYSGRAATPAETVIRPAPMDGWRNYVTVPDGPCGYPMAVQADCYNGCGGGCCCFRPLVFLHNVKRVFDCLLPCNLCCRGGCGGGGCGGCGPMHGCLLGGRTWGHCSMCCGGSMGGCGRGLLDGGCCPNQCGSAYAPSHGGHCTGCSSVVPGAGDSIIDGPTLPIPSAAPSPEVRRSPTYRTQPTRYQDSPANSGSKQSVLRRASAEQELKEPGPLYIDYPRAKPIVRSQSPDSAADVEIPRNPLRN